MTIHMSPTRAMKFTKNPLRALEDYNGTNDWWEGSDDALLFGTIVHNVAEGRPSLEGLTDDEQKLIISSTGKTKGQLKSQFKDATLIGERLHKYVSSIAIDDRTDFEVSIDEQAETGSGIEFQLTGRADMLTRDAVYDFKTVSPQDFDGFIFYKSFRDGREKEYLKQVAFYAKMFDKADAHILYIKKDKKTPFIYDYSLSEVEINGYASEMIDEIEQAVEIVAKPTQAMAVNDGSEWAYRHFGGVIYDD